MKKASKISAQYLSGIQDTYHLDYLNNIHADLEKEYVSLLRVNAQFTPVTFNYDNLIACSPSASIRSSGTGVVYANTGCISAVISPAAHSYGTRFSCNEAHSNNLSLYDGVTGHTIRNCHSAGIASIPNESVVINGTYQHVPLSATYGGFNGSSGAYIPNTHVPSPNIALIPNEFIVTAGTYQHIPLSATSGDVSSSSDACISSAITCSTGVSVLPYQDTIVQYTAGMAPCNTATVISTVQSSLERGYGNMHIQNMNIGSLADEHLFVISKSFDDYSKTFDGCYSAAAVIDYLILNNYISRYEESIQKLYAVFKKIRAIKAMIKVYSRKITAAFRRNLRADFRRIIQFFFKNLDDEPDSGFVALCNTTTNFLHHKLICHGIQRRSNYPLK